MAAATVVSALAISTITLGPAGASRGTAAVAPPTATDVAAAGGVRLTRIQFSPPGVSDLPVTTWKLNQEWVRITNKGQRPRSLKGWRLRDEANHVYKFGTFTLRPGRSVRIHTGRGTNTRTDRYWGRPDTNSPTDYVWNNDGDTAVLKNAAGAQVDRCRYGDGESSAAC